MSSKIVKVSQNSSMRSTSDYEVCATRVINKLFASAMRRVHSKNYKNSSGDEIANVNFYATFPRRRASPGTISVTFSLDVNGWPTYLTP